MLYNYTIYGPLSGETARFDACQGVEGRAVQNWQEALNWARNINQHSYAGYNDWRVPTILEYETIYDPRKSMRSYSGRPIGYPEVFMEGGGSFYWSNQNTGAATGSAWGISFTSGVPQQANMSTSNDEFTVRLVRNGR